MLPSQSPRVPSRRRNMSRDRRRWWARGLVTVSAIALGTVVVWRIGTQDDASDEGNWDFEADELRLIEPLNVEDEDLQLELALACSIADQGPMGADPVIDDLPRMQMSPGQAWAWAEAAAARSPERAAATQNEKRVHTGNSDAPSSGGSSSARRKPRKRGKGAVQARLDFGDTECSLCVDEDP